MIWICTIRSDQSKGLFVCRSAEEGETYTQAMDRHWRAERERVICRRAFAANMPHRQELLLDPDLIFDPRLRLRRGRRRGRMTDLALRAIQSAIRRWGTNT